MRPHHVAMIAGENHDGVVGQPKRFQFRENHTDGLIDFRDEPKIIAFD